MNKYAQILMSKPNLTDNELEKLCKEQGIDEDKTEEYSFKLSYIFLKEFLYNGLSKGIKENVDPKELAMGIKVEMEHTSNVLISTKISLDHLKEDKKYYTHLEEMEKKYSDKYNQTYY